MFQKKIILLLLLLLSSCGYEAIYSKKNSSNYIFSISDLSFVGDKTINLTIKQKLSVFTQNKKNKDLVIKVSSTSKKIVLSKNTAGDATTFKNAISINEDILMNDKFKNNFVILENFNYNNISNKFDLKQLEKDIKNNLAETASDKLIFKLSNIQ